MFNYFAFDIVRKVFIINDHLGKGWLLHYCGRDTECWKVYSIPGARGTRQEHGESSNHHCWPTCAATSESDLGALMNFKRVVLPWKTRLTCEPPSSVSCWMWEFTTTVSSPPGGTTSCCSGSHTWLNQGPAFSLPHVSLGTQLINKWEGHCGCLRKHTQCSGRGRGFSSHLMGPGTSLWSIRSDRLTSWYFCGLGPETHVQEAALGHVMGIRTRHNFHVTLLTYSLQHFLFLLLELEERVPWCELSLGLDFSSGSWREWKETLGRVLGNALDVVYK